MSKQQLYINGNVVDMPDEAVKIKVESNLFSDASKLMTAHSYNIALPRTINNDAIFANAFVPSADTGGNTTHRYLSASLYMDGVPLFERGRAVLESVDEKGYNINLYWGLLGIFDTIKEEGLNVCDLPASRYWQESRARWMYLPQKDDYSAMSPQYISGMSQTIYYNIDSESQSLANRMPWILPSIKAINVLNDIMLNYGLTLQLSTEANIRLNRLWHPLTTTKATAKDESVIINVVVQMHNMDGSGKYEPNWLVPIHDTAHEPNYQWAPLPFPDTPPTLNHSATNGYIANDCVSMGYGVQYGLIGAMTANCDIKVTRVRIFGALPYPSIIHIPNLNDKRIAPTYDSGSTPPQTYDFDIRESFSVSAGEDVLFLADEWRDPPETFQAGILNIQLTIEGASGVQNRRPWSYVRNYPNIGIIDYISELLAHIGGCVVGSVATPNTLKIYTLDEVAATTPIDLDAYGVKSITMGIDNLAQKNVYKHKENDDAGTKDTAEGVIYTSDTTLELERTAFDSKFKVPVLGRVLLWDVDGEKATWNNAGDYIAGYVDGADTIVNTGQDFASVVSNYMAQYEAMVRYPKVVAVVVRLSVLDLLNFDFAKPVYIKQLNRSYLVKTLESESNDTYKLTLVQM